MLTVEESLEGIYWWIWFYCVIPSFCDIILGLFNVKKDNVIALNRLADALERFDRKYDNERALHRIAEALENLAVNRNIKN